MEADGDHPEFDNNSRWPRRLLHVPSMTSYKWEPGNVYGGHCGPDYVALSYTWGRYMLSDEDQPQIKPLRIKGVPWQIPRVNPNTHFCVPEFQHVIHEVMKEHDRFYTFDSWKRDTMPRQTMVSRGLRTILGFLEKTRMVFEFLWLDIGCIDQRWTPITFAEIGRQARIFRHAKHSYAWLSHLSHSTLEPLLFDLVSAVSGLQSELFHQEPQEYDCKPWVAMALSAIKGLTADPWFSSLWTLQEAFLCNHAVLLSREAKVTCDASLIGVRSWALNYLFNLANSIMLWSERTRIDKDDTTYIELLASVHRTGLAALWYNSPMALLGVSYYRKTTRKLDRVYGVMQAFGNDFKVGLSKEGADQGRIYSLSELEDELGTAIIQSYPVLSQMHVYLTAPEFGKGWCVRGDSAVPIIAERGDMFGWDSGNRLDINIGISSQTLCELSTHVLKGNTWGHISGKACNMASLQSAWREVDRSEHAKTMLKSFWRMHRSSTPSVQMIALDRGTGFEHKSPAVNVINVVSFKDEEHQHDLAQSLVEQFSGVELGVLLLGRCNVSDEYFQAGLILFEQEMHGIRHWHRIGICIWLTSHLSKDGVEHPLRDLLVGQSDEWHHVEGLFG